MRKVKNALTVVSAVLLCAMIMFLSVVGAFALDATYNVEELGLSLKIPREYIAITRHTEQGAEEMEKLGLDFDETMTALSAADIFLQATREDKLLKITLSMVKDDNSVGINNYSELTPAQRQDILDSFLSDQTYTSGVEIKRDEIVYFDLYLKKQSTEKTIYGYQCNTVVNGMNINLSIQKDDEELAADEIKVLTNVVSTLDFDDIVLKSGPSFDWWRILLWIAILAIISAATILFYRRNERIKRERAIERRERRKAERRSQGDILQYGFDDAEHSAIGQSKQSLLSALGFDKPDTATQEPDKNPKQIENELDLIEEFENLLGYDTTDYRDRAATELDSLDINVRQKDPTSGVSFFEDNGDSINEDFDYFDNYFKEQVKARPAHRRFFSAIGTYIKIAARHTGYFFKNLFKIIASVFRKKQP